jgi:hypothetical protein
MTNRIALAAAFGLGTALFAGDRALAESKVRFEPRWAVSWEAALQEAKERNVPIIVSFHQDG